MNINMSFRFIQRKRCWLYEIKLILLMRLTKYSNVSYYYVNHNKQQKSNDESRQNRKHSNVVMRMKQL